MKDGEIHQVASPMEVYEYPVNMFVWGFIGSPGMNFIPAKITSKESRFYVDAGSLELEIPLEKEPYLHSKKDKEVILGIRPEHMQDRSFAEKDVSSGSLKAVVEVVEILRSEVQLDVTAGEYSLIARVDPRTQARLHEEIELAVNMDKIHLFEKQPPHQRVKTEERP